VVSATRFRFVFVAALTASAIPGLAIAGASLPHPTPAARGLVQSGQLRSAEIQQSAVGSDQTRSVDVAPQDSHPAGRSYGQWVVAWWRWALKTPASVSPLLDPDSTNCGAGDQPGNVRFLGGTFTGGANDPPVVRRCTVPAGTAFFFPVLNGIWASTPAPNKGCPVAPDPWYGTRPGDPGYREFLKMIYRPAGDDPENPKGSLRLSVDGKAVVGIENWYLRSSAFFNALLPDNNFFDAVIGLNCFDRILVTPNVGYGYHVFLYPLPPGRHTIRWTADAALPLLGDLHQDVTYHITVRPRA